MNNKLLPLLFFFLLLPGTSESADLHTLVIEFSYDAPDSSDKHLLGYRLYKEGVQVCEKSDLTATSMTCDVQTEDGTFNFTLAGYYSDNTETPHSPSFPFTIGSTPDPDPDPDPVSLLAVVSPAMQSGEVPLSVSFDGSGSTGAISSWYWEFGDGTTSTDATANHTYTIPGTYNATLRIEDGSGAYSAAEATITALVNTPPPEPPTAVLGSSTAAGSAPLAVNFDGASSTTPNPPIIKYHWRFGDGSQATGAKTSHAYSTAGTYHAELTVTDSLGLTGKANTPIIVLGTVPANKKPTAKITSDTTEGNAPLAVSFNGSQSSDPDGTIVRYDWNFGDGTTGTGPVIDHTFIDPGSYTISLQVTDNLGEKAEATSIITSNIAPPENSPYFEVGEISIDHEWVTVVFENTFSQPIVIAGPPTVNDNDPVLVRVRNVTPDSFEIRLQEWDYLDGSHDEETFSYMVMEKGIYILDCGIKIEAGSFSGTSRYQNISLQQSYDRIPIILAQVITENKAGAVTGRIRRSNGRSFKYKLQEEKVTKHSHAEETIGYIAWEPGRGEIEGLLFETGFTSESVTDKWFDLSFETTFPAPPLFVADMQSNEDRDPALLRTKNISQTATQIMAEEDQSKNSRIRHRAEVVGYLIIGSAAE